jgi:segregation and condensation protein A
MTTAPIPQPEFQDDVPRMPPQAHEADALLLNIEGYEGPIDVLLDLARNQKVDLAKISILQLVRQYLEFIERAKMHNLDLAAEYLVMAAWLAYLKSRLLLRVTMKASILRLPIWPRHFNSSSAVWRRCNVPPKN